MTRLSEAMSQASSNMGDVEMAPLLGKPQRHLVEKRLSFLRPCGTGAAGMMAIGILKARELGDWGYRCHHAWLENHHLVLPT